MTGNVNNGDVIFGLQSTGRNASGECQYSGTGIFRGWNCGTGAKPWVANRSLKHMWRSLVERWTAATSQRSCPFLRHCARYWHSERLCRVVHGEGTSILVDDDGGRLSCCVEARKGAQPGEWCLTRSFTSIPVPTTISSPSQRSCFCTWRCVIRLFNTARWKNQEHPFRIGSDFPWRGPAHTGLVGLPVLKCWFAHLVNSKIVHRPCPGRLRFALALWVQHAFWRIAQGVDSYRVLADCSCKRRSAANVPNRSGCLEHSYETDWFSWQTTSFRPSCIGVQCSDPAKSSVTSSDFLEFVL